MSLLFFLLLAFVVFFLLFLSVLLIEPFFFLTTFSGESLDSWSSLGFNNEADDDLVDLCSFFELLLLGFLSCLLLRPIPVGFRCFPLDVGLFSFDFAMIFFVGQAVVVYFLEIRC